MGFVDQNLLVGEQVIYRARLHWITFLIPVMMLILGLLLLRDETRAVAVVIISLGALGFLQRWVTYKTSEFAVTTRRVIVKVGFIRRHTLEILLGKVEGIGVDQGIVGRLFGFGTIVVSGTGGTREHFASIAAPLEFRRQVQQQIPA